MNKKYIQPQAQTIALESLSLLAASINMDVNQSDETSTVSNETDLWGNRRNNGNPIWGSLDD